MVQFHFILSFRAHHLQKLDSFFPMVWPLDDFQRPLVFHGLNSWSMCKAALRSWAREELKTIVSLIDLGL